MEVAGLTAPVGQVFSGGRLGGGGRSIREFPNSLYLSSSNCSTGEDFPENPDESTMVSFQRYARGIRTPEVDDSKDLVTSGVLLTLQLGTGSEPLLPRPVTFECKAVSEAFIPSIPLFLSFRTVDIRVEFAASAPMVMVVIVQLSTLCSNIPSLVAYSLPKKPSHH